ncbi:MAG: hypothetical protein VYD12_13595, partial [Pseudomonadota bacterium]|nr:hypothetical protein [Pseudomonadota bacterium]
AIALALFANATETAAVSAVFIKIRFFILCYLQLFSNQRQKGLSGGWCYLFCCHTYVVLMLDIPSTISISESAHSKCVEKTRSGSGKLRRWVGSSRIC